MNIPSPQRIGFLIFLLALVVRLAFVPFSIFNSIPLSGESIKQDGYYEIAANIVEGNGFSRSLSSPIVPDSVRAPLYPLFIAGVMGLFGSYKVVVFLQILLGSFSALCAWLIARKFLSPPMGTIVGVLVALEPYSASLTSILLSETTFTFAFLAGLYVFFEFMEHKRLQMLSFAILLFGLATLIKPTIQYLPFALLIILWLKNEKHFDRTFLKQAAITLAIFYAILSPWMLRQYSTFGTTMLNVQPVSTTYAYLVPSTIALEQGLSFEQASTAFYREQGVHDIEDVNLWNYREFKTRAFTELEKHPLGLVKSIAVTFIAFFTNDAYAGLLTHYGFSIEYNHPSISHLISHPIEFAAYILNLMKGAAAFVVIGRLFWIFATLASLVGAVAYLRARGATPEFLLAVGLIAYFALTTITIGLAVDGRFRIPVEPIIFIFALYALEPLCRLFLGRCANDTQNNLPLPNLH